MALLFASLLLAAGGPRGRSSNAPVRGRHDDRSLDQLRLDIAAVSIEMMQEDTVEAASRSQLIDIGPFYDLVDAGLDRFGVRGIYAGLFELRKFIDALHTVAKSKGLQDFKATIHDQSIDHQPYIQYEGIPNHRKYFHSDNNNKSGGMWWLWHYVGAITADKLLREGSLLLGGSNNNNSERLYGAAAFMRELQRIERLEDSDIMPFHAQHGFIWQYLAAEMPTLDSYPLEVAEAFCGDLLWKDEYIEHVKTDMARDCRHGFGHGVYMVLAVRETVGLDAYSVRQQFRPGSGFLLSNESICEAYKICSGAPNTKALAECKGAMRHSYKLIGVGGTFSDGSSVIDFLVHQENQCNLVQQAAVAQTSLQPHQGSFLGPNKRLYADHEPSFITSPNGQFKFGLDSEGGLSLWNEDSKVWSAGTLSGGDNTYVSMQQADGNLVVYTRSHNNDEDGKTKALWSSKTEGHPDATLRIDNDGQARIYAADDKHSVLWETTANVASVKPSSSSRDTDAAAIEPTQSSQGIDIAWLMSLPNSGTSYTLKATREASHISFATNYGEESKTEVPLSVFQGSQSGPFWPCCEGHFSRVNCPFKCPTEGFVLTKTHCGREIEISQEQFLQDCLMYTGGFDHSSPGYYDLATVKRAVHLIRDPFDSIVSRFNHEHNTRMSNAEKRQYSRTPSGFRDFCRDKLDAQPSWSRTFDRLVMKKLAGVPCRTDFAKYIMWHNHAFTITRNDAMPTLTIHYESYGKDWNATIGALLEFLDQPRIKNNLPLPVDDTKSYRQYFKPDEIETVRSAFEVIASGMTWSNIQHYFDDNENIAPVPTQTIAKDDDKHDAGTSTEYGSRPLSHPSRSNLIRDNKIIGDVSWELDFAIIGYPKCGTSYLMRYLSSSSSELYLPKHENCALSKNDPAGLASMYYDVARVSEAGHNVKVGLKCPPDVDSASALDNYADYFPNTDFIVTTRHPVEWFQSYYNFRLSFGNKMPDPLKLIGPCIEFDNRTGLFCDPSDRAHWNGTCENVLVCTDRSNFHHGLSRFKKTPTTSPREQELLKGRTRGPVEELNGRLFVMEVQQMNQTGEVAHKFIADLSDFLRLDQELPPPPIPKRDSAGSRYENFKDRYIDICEDKYIPIRAELLKNGASASEWIRDYFLESDGVFVSQRDEFLDLISKWGIDPCNSS